MAIGDIFCGSPSAPEVIEHRMSQADHCYAIVALLPSVFECRQPGGVKSSDKLNIHHPLNAGLNISLIRHQQIKGTTTQLRPNLFTWLSPAHSKLQHDWFVYHAFTSLGTTNTRKWRTK